MDWLRRRKHLALLAALLLLLVVYPVLESVGGQVLLDVLLTIVFLTSFAVVFEGRGRLLVVLLGVPTLIGQWTGYALPDTPRAGVGIGFHLVSASFLFACIALILKAIHREPKVSLDDVCGALCGYLLVGVAFSHLYCLTEALAPGSFRGVPASAPPDGARLRLALIYFSLVTLTTLGYGDVVPAGDGARGLAVVEAVLGQFYLAVLLAELIGKRVSQALSEPPGPKGP